MTLPRAVAAFLGAQLLSTTWAVAYQLPYQFGGQGAPERVLRDFWTHGTALSAPAPMLVVIGIVSLLAMRRGRTGTATTAILLVLMAVAVVAGILEPALRQALRGGFSPLVKRGILILTFVNLALALLVIVVAVRHLRDRFPLGGAAVGAA